MQRVLMISLGENLERKISFTDGETPLSILIGRDTDCDVVVPSCIEDWDTVSRKHVRIFRSNDGYWIEDLGSKNLTWLEGRVILFPTRVSLPCGLILGRVPIHINLDRLSDEELDDLTSSWPPPYDDESYSVPTTAIGDLDWHEALKTLGKSARFSGILINVAEVLTHAKNPEKATQALQHVLEIHLQASRISLAFDLSIRKGVQRLRNATFSKEFRDRLENVTLDKPVFTHSSADAGQIVWGFLAGHYDEDKVVFAIGRFSDEDFADADTDQVSSLVSAALEMAVPVIRRLRELQAYHAAQRESVSRVPSKETFAESKRSNYWGRSKGFANCLYMAEVAANIYLELDTGDHGLKVIFLKGEIGAGKTSLASLIHRLSSRRQKPLVQVSAGSLVETLAESQLFGIRKGAAYGVDQDRPGWFYVADGGTLFIDDIGHLPLSVQKDFLTLLSEGLYTWIGDTASSNTDAHIIVSANQDLEVMVSDGMFLPDLKSRIEIFEITVPPLRDRKEDIQLLIDNQLELLRRKNPSCKVTEVSPELMDALLVYDWPQNLRELTSLLQGAVVMAMATSGVSVLDWEHLQPQHRDRILGATKKKLLQVICDTSLTYDENVAALEREYIARLLGKYKGAFEKVKKRSGKARDTVKRMEARLKEFLVDAPVEEVDRFRGLAGEGWRRIDPDSKP